MAVLLGAVAFAIIVPPVVSRLLYIKDTFAALSSSLVATSDPVEIQKIIDDYKKEIDIIYTFLCELPGLKDDKGEIKKFGDDPFEYRQMVIADAQKNGKVVEAKGLIYIRFPRSLQKMIETLIEIITEMRRNLGKMQDKLDRYNELWILKSMRGADYSEELKELKMKEGLLRRHFDVLASMVREK